MLGIDDDTLRLMVHRGEIVPHIRGESKPGYGNVIAMKVGARNEIRWSPESLWRWWHERTPSLDRKECVEYCREFPLPTPDRTPRVVDAR